ncbi:MAG: NAD(P)-dependent alcohol dehydrogenase, partial [Chloroflexi bacterium]|nr:NAD(P)-dependent alcohol dehydrogenase [Chloroflexota bacterium]
QVGDAVFASTGYDMGGNAEYCCMPANGIVATKPANLTFQEAAAVPFGARTALFLLRDQGRIEAGQHILINGASGSVGTYAVQLACHFGAQVTAVCSTRHVEVVRSLGADHVIDYTREDFTQGSETYDLIFDAVGKTTVPRCRPILKPAGTFVSAVMPFSAVKGLWYRLTEGRRVLGGSIPRDPELLLFLRDLCEAGAVRPVIERRYPLDEIVEAHRYVDQGHKQGNVVITVAH